MQGDDRPSLKGLLDLLTRDENPPRNGTLNEEYVILRRFDVRKGFVYVEFVDGDEKDDKEWFEGPVPENLSIGALFAMRDNNDRETRREAYGRMKLRDKAGNKVWTVEKSERSEVEVPPKPTITDNDETAVETVQGSVDKEEGASESTDDYAIGESTNAVTHGAAGTRRRTSHKIKKRKSESLARVVDTPNDSYPRMDTCSKTR
jgi:hypothetical protein